MKDTIILIGQRIKDLRTSKGISQEELAFQASLNAPNLGQIERGLKNSSIETLVRIASALEVPLSEFFLEIPIASSNEKSATLNKIEAYLFAMTEEQQKEILKVIRAFERYKNTDGSIA